MLDGGTAMMTDTERSGRASGKEIMARPHDQDGTVVVHGKRRKMWVLRWRESVLQPRGTLRCMQRAGTLGTVTEITKKKAERILQDQVAAANRGQRRP